MAVNNFIIGQRVRVVRLGEWNGTPPLGHVQLLRGWWGTVTEIHRDSIGVTMTRQADLGVLQFLCNELEVVE